MYICLMIIDLNNLPPGAKAIQEGIRTWSTYDIQCAREIIYRESERRRKIFRRAKKNEHLPESR